MYFETIQKVKPADRPLRAVRLQAYKLMTLRHTYSSVEQEPAHALVPPGHDTNSPFACLYKMELHFGLTFEAILDHLWMIAETMNSNVMRQHTSYFPSDASIIVLLEHIIQTINIALSTIGYRLPDKNIDSFNYTKNERQPKTSPSSVYDDCVQLIEMAMERCKRLRAIQGSPSSRILSNPLGIIVEERPQLLQNVHVQAQKGIRVDTVPSGRPRRYSGGVSPRTIISPSNRVESFTSSDIANTTIGRPVKLYVSIPLFA